MTKTFRIALAGNPNVGKSTLFNSLTGAHQHTGNWPGKTIEKKEGTYIFKKIKYVITDLPGTYSLTAFSIEESIARNYILKENPDVVLQVLDGSNLERNLFLTIQLLELGAPLILAINMVDIAEKRGIYINEKVLSGFLRLPVIIIHAKKKQGIYELQKKVCKVLKKKKHFGVKITYGEEVTNALEAIYSLVCNSRVLPSVNKHFLALKLFENDFEYVQMVRKEKSGNDVVEKIREKRVVLERLMGVGIDTIMTDARYGFIEGVVKGSVKKPQWNKKHFSDRVDTIVTNRFLGGPIFLLCMYLIFEGTFTFGAPLVRGIEYVLSFLSTWGNSYFLMYGFPEWLRSFLLDGVLSGMGSVLLFIPNIFLLFAFISIMEDTGYMARVAYISDKYMHRIGLHGKSFIPLIIGFGCNVPAIMATRTLESVRERLLTMLVIPFMACSSRLPIFVLFTGAFFTHYQGLIIFSLYLLGVIVAIGVGWIFRKILFQGVSQPLVIELPPYRVPTLFSVVLHMWQKGKMFIKKAGGIILLLVILVWFLGNIPFGVEYASEESLIGMIGSFIAPVFAPLGFGDWESSVALLFGIAAKEVMVGVLGAVYGVSESGLVSVLSEKFTPLSAYSFMVFALLYIPCLAVFAVLKQETGTWKWPLFSFVYMTMVAWIASFCVYQIGSMFLTV